MDSFAWSSFALFGLWPNFVKGKKIFMDSKKSSCQNSPLLKTMIRLWEGIGREKGKYMAWKIELVGMKAKRTGDK